MPTYEYVCKSCGYGWEAQQRISEPPLTECPKCQKATAQRQISGGNFILKGGGWYADLYASSPKKSESSSSSSTPSEKPKSEAPKADSSTTTSTTSTSKDSKS